MTGRRRPVGDPHVPLRVTRPELRALAQRLADAQHWTLAALEVADPIGVDVARGNIERLIQAVQAAGWRPPPALASTVDELQALPPGTVVTDPDGHAWVRNRVGEWCEPYPAGIDPVELLVDGPVVVQIIPAARGAAGGTGR